MERDAPGSTGRRSSRETSIANGTQGSKLAASSRAAKIGSATLGARVERGHERPCGMKIPFGRRHAAQRLRAAACGRRRNRQAARAPFRRRRRRVPIAQIDLDRIVVRQPVERAAKTPGHHRGIERRGQEPRRQRRAPMRHGLGDQRMALRGERADFGRSAIEGRCVGETGLGRKPDAQTSPRPFDGSSGRSVAAIVGHRAAAGGVDQTGRHAGAALHRGLQLAPRHRQVGRFRKQLD